MADKMHTNSSNKSEGARGRSSLQILVAGAAIIVLVLLVKFVFLGDKGPANAANGAIDLLKQERFSEAEEKLQKAFANDPELMFASELKEPNLFYVGLANAYLENGDLNTASRYYTEGYQIDSSGFDKYAKFCLLYTSPSPRDRTRSRMPSSA